MEEIEWRERKREGKREGAVGKEGSDSSFFWSESRWIFVHSPVFAGRRGALWEEGEAKEEQSV